MEGPSRSCPDGELEGAADLAFVLEEPFPSKVLAVEKLRDEQILIVAAPGHRLAGRFG